MVEVSVTDVDKKDQTSQKDGIFEGSDTYNTKDNTRDNDDKGDGDQHAYNEDATYDPVEEYHGVGVSTLEEEEEEMLSLPARLFRYDITAKEWKERGAGNMRFLKHQKTKKVRLIMRRKRVGKLCSNHYITPEMKLKPHSGSDKSYIWTTAADMSDGAPNQEMLAIRFSKFEEAEQFKKLFEEVQQELRKNQSEVGKSRD